MSQLADVRVVTNTGGDERVIVCASGRLVQTFIVVSERYLVLVDTMATPEDAAALLEVARPHLAGRQLLVVNSHADWDHVWGNQLFAGAGALHPAPLLASQRCVERLRSPEAGQKLAHMRAKEPGRFDTVVPTAPTLGFTGELAIDGGDLTLRLLPTPGHTPDHLALFIPEAGLLLAGDAAESPFPIVNAPADLPELRASIALMADLAPRALLCCHAPVSASPALLRDNLAYFDLLEARCRAAHGTGAAVPTDDERLEAWAALPFAEAVPAGWPLTQTDPQEVMFYRDAHRRAIRAMDAWLQSTEQNR